MGRQPSGRRASVGGFTLVEILIVVLLIAIMAAIAFPQFQSPAEDTRHVTFIHDLHVFAEAAKLYRLRTGENLENAAAGALPTGWDEYVDVKRWTRETPIGGAWDVEQGSYGLTSCLGVDFADGGGLDRDDTYMLEIDRICDDGNLATGQFRKITDGRYYYVLVP